MKPLLGNILSIPIFIQRIFHGESTMKEKWKRTKAGKKMKKDEKFLK